jgi:hypothetical protein
MVELSGNENYPEDIGLRKTVSYGFLVAALAGAIYAGCMAKRFYSRVDDKRSDVEGVGGFLEETSNERLLRIRRNSSRLE